MCARCAWICPTLDKRMLFNTGHACGKGGLYFVVVRLPCRGWLQEVEATVPVASNNETFPGQVRSAGKAQSHMC